MSESTDLDTVAEGKGNFPIRGYREEYEEVESSSPKSRFGVYWKGSASKDSSVDRRCHKAVLFICKLVDYVTAGEESISEEFERLKENWEEETAHVASPREKAIHPSYQRIIGMGMAAVPFILSELKRKPDHWFWALKAITGVDPVPAEDMGDMEQMAEDWVDWFEEGGLASDKSGSVLDEWKNELSRTKKGKALTDVQFRRDISASQRRRLRDNES